MSIAPLPVRSDRAIPCVAAPQDKAHERARMSMAARRIEPGTARQPAEV